MTTLFLFVTLFVFMLLGMPIAISLGLSSLLTILLFANDSMASLSLKFFQTFEQYTLLAIPFFILAGSFMTTGGVARRMINFAIAAVGHLHGGLAIASVLACMLFAAVSGSSPATVVAVGSIVIAGMVRTGYTKEFAAGVICNSGTLGILIPPSIVMVVYAAATESSIGRLFMAGVIPGLLLGLMLMGAIYVVARYKNLPRQPRASLARRFGRELLDRLDFALGARARPLDPIRPPPDFSAARSFLEPILTRPAIDRAVTALLDDLCDSLAEAGRGARRLSLLAFRVDGAVQEVAVGTGLASRDPAPLLRLFAGPLERLEPDLGFERMVLQATETNPLGGHQLTGRLGRHEAGDGGRALSELLDRLGQRLSLWRMEPTGSHWPEHAAVPVDAYAPVAVPAGWGERLRPVRLLDRPREMTVLAEAPDGPPAQLWLDGQVHRVRHAAGPERLEPEWWTERHDRPRRDYYRVQTESGRRLWICRLGQDRPAAPARWFLHGELA